MMYRQRDVRVVNGFADSMIRDITNYRISYAESGAVSAEYEYDPFGKVIAHTAEAVFRVRNSCCDPERTGLSVISEKEMGEMIIW